MVFQNLEGAAIERVVLKPPPQLLSYRIGKCRGRLLVSTDALLKRSSVLPGDAFWRESTRGGSGARSD